MLDPPKLDHIAIAVTDLEAAVEGWAELLGFDPDELEREQVASEGIEMVMIPLSDGVQVELMEPTTSESAVAKFLDRHGEGIHHIGFESHDVEADWEELRDRDLELASDAPVESSLGDLIGFVHPRALNSVLVELKQHGSSTDHE